MDLHDINNLSVVQGSIVNHVTADLSPIMSITPLNVNTSKDWIENRETN